MEVGGRELCREQDLDYLDLYDGRYELPARSSESSLPNMRSTFSAALNKFSTLTRRKTSSDDNLITGQFLSRRSRTPTPSGVPHSTSFFKTRFSAKTPTQAEPDGRKDRKVSAKLVRSTSWLHRVNVSAPLTLPIPAPVEVHRESSVQITQHKLMGQVPPPMPQSKRMSLVVDPTTPNSSPGYLRSTSSSQAKRRERVLSGGNHSSVSRPPTSNKQRQQAPQEKKLAGEIKRYSEPWNDNAGLGSKIPTTAIRCSRQSVLGTPRQNSVSAQTPGLRNQSTSNRPLAMDQTYGGNNSPRVREQRTARPIISGRITQIRRIERGIPQSVSTPNNLTFAQRAIQIYGTNDEYVTMMPTTALDHLIDPNNAPSPSLSDSERSLGSGGSGFSTPTPGDLRHERLKRCPTLGHSTIDGPMADQWWLGRVFALADFFKTEELTEPAPRLTPEPALAGGSQIDSVRPKRSMLDDDIRNRRVFLHLKSLCTTDVARESLKGFKSRFEDRLVKEGEWERGQSSPPKKEDKGKGKESEVKEKLSVFDRLKMRKNRTFGKSGTQDSAEAS